MVYAVPIRAHIAGGVFQYIGGLAERFACRRKRRVHLLHVFELHDGAVQRRHRAAIPRKTPIGRIRRLSQGLCVLDTRKLTPDFFVFLNRRAHFVYALHDETGLFQLGRACTGSLLHTLELGLRLGRDGEGALIRSKRSGHVLSRPRIKHGKMARCFEQALVLMLAAQVDRRSDAGGKLADRGHGTVYGNAAASVRTHLPNGHMTVGGVFATQEEPALNRGCRFPLADRCCIGAFAHQEFYGREKRCFARARFARDDGKPRRRSERSIANQSDVFDMKLVKHTAPRKTRHTARIAPNNPRPIIAQKHGQMFETSPVFLVLRAKPRGLSP